MGLRTIGIKKIGLRNSVGSFQSWSAYCKPQNLTITDIVGGVRLTWTEGCTQNDGYEIWVSVDGGTYYLLDTVVAGIITYDDMTDWSGHSVQYKVRAYRGTSYSEYSDETTIIIVEEGYLHRPNGNEYAYVADNGALDIYGTGITFAMWVRGTSPIAPPAFFWLGGKHVFAGTEGRYGFYAEQTTGYLSSYCVLTGGSTVGNLLIDNVKIGADWGAGSIDRKSTVQLQDEAWHFMVLRISAGTTAHMANQFEFYLGAGNNAAGDGVTLISKADISKAILYKSVLSDAECTDLYNGIIKDGYTAYWKCDDYPITDETGNYNLSGVNLSAANILTEPTIP